MQPYVLFLDGAPKTGGYFVGTLGGCPGFGAHLEDAYVCISLNVARRWKKRIFEYRKGKLDAVFMIPVSVKTEGEKLVATKSLGFCGTCLGEGEVDSGGQDQNGNWINIRCPECGGACVENNSRQ